MKLQYIKNVAKLNYKQEKCVGCEMCVNVCPHNVFKMEDKKAILLDKNDCMECGACAKNCPTGAILVESGVGCAAAVLRGMINNTAPTCGCTNDKKSCC